MKIKDPKAVYFDSQQGKFVQNGIPVTGKYNGVNYKDGKDLDKLNPSPTNYGDSLKSQAYLLHIYYDFDQAYRLAN